MKTYSHLQELTDNIPYIVMVGVGAALISLAPLPGSLPYVGAGAYAVYGVLGALWIMVFVCPYCAFFDTRSCPCGYGQIAPLFRRRAEVECFSTQFKRHIPVIVPLWLIPPGLGGYSLYLEFSWLIVGLMVAFVVDAYLILPLVSTKHGCVECPQRETCPWMKGPQSK